MPPQRRILDKYLERLAAATSRSPLLKVVVGKAGRLLDCTRLQCVSPDRPRRLLSAIVEGKPPVEIKLILRGDPPGDSGQGAGGGNPKARGQANPHPALYELLDKRMRRHAEMAKRETGVHALWLGYPLLYVSADDAESGQCILAPVFLWPVSIELDLHREGRLEIGRLKVGKDPCPPQFNLPMSAWINRKLNLRLPEPGEDELEELGWEEVKNKVKVIAGQFQPPLHIDCDSPLGEIPALKGLASPNVPRFFNSAVLGYFRWQNEAIMADLAKLGESDECNGVVSAFIQGTPLQQPGKIPPPAEEDRFVVTEADFSQERVVWQTRMEPGLVVHGPPGTGKSQTIVNVIADALAHGRKVLMVCQKQAATRVVLERLRAAGLADLCLEVHDTEFDRLTVFKAIREQVDALPDAVQAGAAARRSELSQQISHLEAELDSYAHALHANREKCKCSYRQMKMVEGQVHTQHPNVREVAALREVVAGLSHQDIKELCPEIEAAGRSFRAANPLGNPWRHRRSELQLSVTLKDDLLSILKRLVQADSAHAGYVRQYGKGIALPANRNDFPSVAQEVSKRLRPMVEKPGSWGAQLTKAWLRAIRGASAKDVDLRREQCREASKLAKSLPGMQLDSGWEALRIPSEHLTGWEHTAQLLLDYRDKWWRFFSFGFRRACKAIRQLRPEASSKPVWETAKSLLAYCDARNARARLAEMNRALLPGFPAQLTEKGHEQFPQLVLQALETAHSLDQLERQHDWIKPILDAFLLPDNAPTVAGMLAEVERAAGRFPLAAKLIDGLRELHRSFLKSDEVKKPYRDVMEGNFIGRWLNALSVGFEGLDALLRLENYRIHRDGRLRKLLHVLEEYERRRSAGEPLPSPPRELSLDEHGRWWGNLVWFAAVKTWQRACEQEHPELVRIDPESHAQKVEQLRALLAEKRALEAGVIRERWVARQIAHRKEPWNRLFQLRKSKQGESKRLREAVKLSLPSGLLTMRPCWLVNPAAASQLFPLEPGLFDLVIFDEASQCPIEQAIPAIFRGKVLVVAGDEKQLPPTSFFSARIDADEGEDQADDEDATVNSVEDHQRRLRELGMEAMAQVEDLLEGAISANLPQSYLRVHYRSEHPDLIQFSNYAFYGGQLEAPPSRGGVLNAHRPILYHDVSGVYSQRTNRKEAERVVSLLKNYWLKDTNCPTIGVVTFNQPQRELIADLIDEACQQDEAFATRYQQERDRKESNQDVGFFIKNLESVQGDERDVIMFSTTFGPDPNGKFFRRFGPVGAAGGERRLNVAISRAKKQVVIVGSMRVNEIATALQSNAAPGAKLTPAAYLQLYLAYAKAVSDANPDLAKQILGRLATPACSVKAGAGPESPFEEEVFAELTRLGYNAVSQVGDSGFRIDLAVLHRDPRHGYVLGIECDGATYHSDRSARSRDVWRQQILEARGWKIHRIWSTRWWYQKVQEIQKLQRAIENGL